MGQEFWEGSSTLVTQQKLTQVTNPGLQTELGSLASLYSKLIAIKFRYCIFSDPAYGITIDYVYDTLGVAHSYTIELRPSDGDDNGFILPACQIIDSGKEIMAAFKAITPIMAENPKRKVKRDRKLRSQ